MPKSCGNTGFLFFHQVPEDVSAQASSIPRVFRQRDNAQKGRPDSAGQAPEALFSEDFLLFTPKNPCPAHE